MFAYLIRLSLTHRVLVLGAAGMLILVGSVQLRRVPVDVLPEIDRSVVFISTEAGGMASEEVERRISFPIETAMSGLKGVESVRSKSSTSLSVVTVTFALNTDLYRNRLLVAERLDQVRQILPANLRPEMGPLATVVGEILRISLTSDTGDMMALRDVADWLIRPRLMAVPGVSMVFTYGGDVRQLRITLDPRRLDYYGIGVDEVEQALAGFNANTGGDAIDQYGRRFQITNIARAPDVETLVERARRHRRCQIAGTADSTQRGGVGRLRSEGQARRCRVQGPTGRRRKRPAAARRQFLGGDRGGQKGAARVAAGSAARNPRQFSV